MVGKVRVEYYAMCCIKDSDYTKLVYEEMIQTLEKEAEAQDLALLLDEFTSDLFK